MRLTANRMKLKGPCTSCWSSIHWPTVTLLCSGRNQGGIRGTWDCNNDSCIQKTICWLCTWLRHRSRKNTVNLQFQRIFWKSGACAKGGYQALLSSPALIRAWVRGYLSVCFVSFLTNRSVSLLQLMASDSHSFVTSVIHPAYKFTKDHMKSQCEVTWKSLLTFSSPSGSRKWESWSVSVEFLFFIPLFATSLGLWSITD